MKLNIVPARTGLHWFRLGIRTFLRQPLALTGLFFMYTAAASLLSLLPGVGVFLALAIVPAATLGLMAATHEAAEGRFPSPKVLVSGFRAGRQRLRAMLVLGGLYAAGCVLVMVLVPLAFGLPTTREAASPENLVSPELQAAMLLGMVLYMPLSLMFWHAPALVHWYGISPVKSLFFSWVACWRNWRPMLTFALAWAALVFGGSTLIVLIAAALGNVALAASAIMPVGLLVTAMFSTSLYFTFRDSFVAEPQDPVPQPEEQP